MSRIDEALRRARQGAGDAEPPAPLAADLPVTEPEPVREPFREPEPAAPAAPALVSEPLYGPLLNGKLIVSSEIAPGAVEEYRKLAAALHQVDVARATKVVMVASAGAREGKTLTAANLALTLSKSFKRRVLLVDTDLRRPMVHEVFGVANTAGLNDGLAAPGDVKLSLIEVSPRLTVLPAGPPNPDPMGGLTSERMRRIIDEAASKFEWVVLDTPPVGLLPDAHLLAEMVDMVVLVVNAGTTPLRVVRRAVDALNRKRIAGVVLNRVVASSAAIDYSRYQSDRGDAPA